MVSVLGHCENRPLRIKSGPLCVTMPFCAVVLMVVASFGMEAAVLIFYECKPLSRATFACMSGVFRHSYQGSHHSCCGEHPDDAGISPITLPPPDCVQFPGSS